MKDLGLYVHIPFCKSKCVYCDFLSAPAEENTYREYVAALCKEIDYAALYYKEELKSRLVKTVFLGGGTPSIIEPQNIEQIINKLKDNFNFDDNVEITIECNPGTVSLEKLERYKKSGINRISFGLQSFNDDELKMLGRIHTSLQFDESFKMARKAGFKNINVDIMSALPGQTKEKFLQTVKKIILYQPEHISMYSLIVEEGTRLFENLEKFPSLPDEDTERNMYYEAVELLEKNGYHQYEISNFAKEGFACKHNISYWERKEYLGFGIGAASLFNDTRYTIIDALGDYIDNYKMNCKMNYNKKLLENNLESIYNNKYYENIIKDVNHLSKKDMMEEYMFLGLRETNGIKISTFENLFSEKMMDIYGKIIEKYVREGFLNIATDRLFFTPKGRDVSNVILSEFLL